MWLVRGKVTQRVDGLSGWCVCGQDGGWGQLKGERYDDDMFVCCCCPRPLLVTLCDIVDGGQSITVSASYLVTPKVSGFMNTIFIDMHTKYLSL